MLEDFMLDEQPLLLILDDMQLQLQLSLLQEYDELILEDD